MSPNPLRRSLAAGLLTLTSTVGLIASDLGGSAGAANPAGAACTPQAPGDASNCTKLLVTASDGVTPMQGVAVSTYSPVGGGTWQQSGTTDANGVVLVEPGSFRYSLYRNGTHFADPAGVVEHAAATTTHMHTTKVAVDVCTSSTDATATAANIASNGSTCTTVAGDNTGWAGAPVYFTGGSIGWSEALSTGANGRAYAEVLPGMTSFRTHRGGTNQQVQVQVNGDGSLTHDGVTVPAVQFRTVGVSIDVNYDKNPMDATDTPNDPFPASVPINFTGLSSGWLPATNVAPGRWTAEMLPGSTYVQAQYAGRFMKQLVSIGECGTGYDCEQTRHVQFTLEPVEVRSLTRSGAYLPNVPFRYKSNDSAGSWQNSQIGDIANVPNPIATPDTTTGFVYVLPTGKYSFVAGSDTQVLDMDAAVEPGTMRSVTFGAAQVAVNLATDAGTAVTGAEVYVNGVGTGILTRNGRATVAVPKNQVATISAKTAAGTTSTSVTAINNAAAITVASPCSAPAAGAVLCVVDSTLAPKTGLTLQAYNPNAGGTYTPIAHGAIIPNGTTKILAGYRGTHLTVPMTNARNGVLEIATLQVRAKVEDSNHSGVQGSADNGGPTVTYSGPAAGWSTPALTDAEGFVTDEALPGTTKFTAYMFGARRTETVDVSATSADVVFTTVRVNVEVRDGDGVAVPNVQVSYTGPAAGHGYVNTGSTGLATVEVLPATIGQTTTHTFTAYRAGAYESIYMTVDSQIAKPGVVGGSYSTIFRLARVTMSIEGCASTPVVAFSGLSWGWTPATSVVHVGPTSWIATFDVLAGNESTGVSNQQYKVNSSCGSASTSSDLSVAFPIGGAANQAVPTVTGPTVTFP